MTKPAYASSQRGPARGASLLLLCALTFLLPACGMMDLSKIPDLALISFNLDVSSASNNQVTTGETTSTSTTGNVTTGETTLTGGATTVTTGETTLSNTNTQTQEVTGPGKSGK